VVDGNRESTLDAGSSATLSSMLRKVLVLAITAVQVVVFGSLIVWRVIGWNENGWAGLAYNIDTEVEREEPLLAIFVGGDSRQVEMVVPGGPADQAGIEVGDLVVSVNGVLVADDEGLRELAGRSRTGDELEYRFDRSGASRDAPITLEAPYGNPLIVAGTATSVVVGAVFILISMLVYWSRSRSRVALVFFLMCVFGAAEYLVWAAVELDLPSLRGIAPATIEPLVLLGLGVVGIFAVALVNTLLHLSLLFPRTRPVVGSWPQVLVWIHTLPFIPVLVVVSMTAVAFASKSPWGGALTATAMVFGSSAAVLRLRRLGTRGGWLLAAKTHPWTMLALVLLVGGAAGFALRLLPQPLKSVVLAVAGVGSFVVCILIMTVFSIITVVTLYRSYRESGIDEQRQVRWPLWGTLTAVGSSVVLTVISVVISLVFGEVGRVDFSTSVVLNASSKMVYLLIPISLAFGIVKYRLMEIDLIIRKTVVYSAVTGFLLVVYLALAGFSGLALVRSAGFESQVATVVATLVVVALFVPVRNRVQRVVDRLFFQREHDTEASIARITETVMQAPSVEVLTIGVAEEVQLALHCSSVAILTRSAGGDRLVTAATVGLAESAVSKLVVTDPDGLLDGGLTKTAADLESLSGDSKNLIRGSRAERGVVCHRGDTVVGLVLVGRKLSKEPYDDSDEVFLEAVAGQLAVGLGRLRGRRAELEFAQALQIQRSLLPAEIPQIEGIEVVARWRPAREVSGDYYDVLRLDDHRLAVCIGDVVGKGMPAALLMSSLQAAVKAVATDEADPVTVCSQVRTVVTSNLQGGKFVTFFFAIVDGASKRLTYTNCGHNQPVLVRENGDAVRLGQGGPAFARLMRDLPYKQEQLDLDPGDRLVLFTDGVSEAEDRSGEQFGEERLESLVVEHRGASATDLEQILTDVVVEHADGELQDDLTLVVLAVD